MKKITLLFLILPFLGLSQVQIGQDINGEYEDDESGKAIALSADGSRIVITSKLNNNVDEYDSGRTRVFDNLAGEWIQIGQDIDIDGNDPFIINAGDSVSISGDGSIIAIGSTNYGVVSGGNYFSDVGIVTVFQYNGVDTWVQLGQSFIGDSFPDELGQSVSLSNDGTKIAISSSKHNLSDGRIRIYEYDSSNNTWDNIGPPIQGISNEELGFSIELSDDGNRIVISQPLFLSNRGLVRIYENQLETWVKIGQDIYGESSGDRFGFSVSISGNGNFIAVGAPFNDGAGNNNGRVKIYEYDTTNNWIQVGSNINGINNNDWFGRSVSLNQDGNLLISGSEITSFNDTTNSSTTGYVLVFKNISGNWTQVGSAIDGENDEDFFGGAVSLSNDGSILAAGAVRNDNTSGDNSGHVRVFSIASELAILEVIEDIAGNVNGINITASQLNSINGVSGAIDGVNYTTALDNGTFVDENNPTAAEIQFIIDQVNATLNINDNELLSFKLFPNPTKTQFTIQLSPSFQLEKVVVYNTLGQVILTSEETIVNTSKLASGSYVVEVITNKGKVSKQLIIE